VVQSAYKSLILRYGDGALAAEGWDGLWGLLTIIMVRKCADRARYYQADRRNISREAARGLEHDGLELQDAIGREPTPEQAIVLAETVEGVLGKLTVDERTMIE